MTSKKQLLDAIRVLDIDGVRAALEARPELARGRDPDGQTPLHRCARVLAPGGDPGLEAVAIARLLLDAGAPVDAVRLLPDERRDFEATPLWYAVEQGRNPGVIDLLLARGASPDRVLWSALVNEDLVTAAKLERAGVKLEGADVARLVLFGCIRARKKRSVAWLLERPVAIDAVDQFGQGALHHGVLAKVTMPELKALIAAGASTSVRDRDGKTASELAADLGRVRVAKLLA